jgi:hypothetical protein
MLDPTEGPPNWRKAKTNDWVRELASRSGVHAARAAAICGDCFGKPGSEILGGPSRTALVPRLLSPLGDSLNSGLVNQGWNHCAHVICNAILAQLELSLSCFPMLDLVAQVVEYIKDPQDCRRGMPSRVHGWRPFSAVYLAANVVAPRSCMHIVADLSSVYLWPNEQLDHLKARLHWPPRLIFGLLVLLWLDQRVW